MPPTDSEELIPTRHSLLLRLKDWEDHTSWQDFFDTYWRLLYGVAIRAGLSDAEAQEVVQETVITVARRIPEFEYKPSVCAFKTWLLNLTRWRIIDQMRKRKSPAGNVQPAASEVPLLADNQFEAAWETEWHQHLISRATDRIKSRIRPEQYQIFDLSVFKGWSVKQIARQLDVSFGTIYVTKHRVGAMLKKEIRALEKELSRGPE
jgi:RNA polymerase sigma factor (sigma-70 family)